MPNKNIDLEITVKNSLDKVRIIYKNFLLFIKEDFLLRNEHKAHNLSNHIENFKEKIKVNQQAENPRDFRKYDIHYVNFGINIGNEINGIRPSLIIKSNRYNRGFDILVIPMTGLHNSDGTEKDLDTFDIIIKPDDNNKLSKYSLLKMRHLKSISKKRVLGRVGKVENTIIDEVKNTKLYDKIDDKIKQMMGIK